MKQATDGSGARASSGAAPATEPGSPRQLAWLYAPAEARDDVAALLELEAEIGHGARPGIEHTVAHARLAWWLEELAGIASGGGRHPLARRLLESFSRAGLSPPDLRGLGVIAQLDLACAAFETEQEYSSYLNDWSRGLFRNIALRLCPALDARAALEAFVGLAGPALRDLELIARLADDARLGRLHVVLDSKAAADPAIVSAWQRQPWPADACEALRDRIASRRGELCRAAAMLPPPMRSPLRPLLAWCALACELADRAQAALPLQYHAGRLTPLRAAWTAWRAALAASRGRLPQPLEENG